MSRGDHLEIIFRDDHYRELFLATLGEAGSRTDWQVHAFCLMSNHFHTVIQKKAERILLEELNRRGREPQRLEQLAKADPEKLNIARRLRAQTCVSLRWIAQHLSMGAPAYLGNCLRIAKRCEYANVRP